MTILLADGLEEAYIGLVHRFGQQPLACYDVDKVIDIYMSRSGMTYEEAVEFFEFNVIGAWVGNGTPCFLYRSNIDELEDYDDEQ